MPARQRSSRLAATLGNASQKPSCDLEIRRTTGVIVVKRQRFCAMRQQRVGGICNQIHADRFVHSGRDRDLELAAETAASGDQNGILKARRTGVEQRYRARKSWIGARPQRALRKLTGPRQENLAEFHAFAMSGGPRGKNLTQEACGHGCNRFKISTSGFTRGLLKI